MCPPAGAPDNQTNMKLNEIQQKLKVPKSHRNDFGKYDYRNAEDILEAVKPLLGDSLLTISDEVVQVGDRFYVKFSAYFREDAKGTNPITVIAFARESDDKKGMDAAQITGAASSYARKYALNGLFLIDDTKDADSEDNAYKTAPEAVKAPQRRANPPVYKEEEQEAAEAKRKIVFLVDKMRPRPADLKKDDAQGWYAAAVEEYTTRSLPLATTADLVAIVEELEELYTNNQ
jgi:hypothetical protein